MSLTSFIHKHIGTSNDYKPRDSFVNKARREGLSKPLVGAGVGAALGGATGFAWGLSNLANDHVFIENSRVELTRPTLVGADYDPPDDYVTYYTDADGNMQTQWHHDPADWDPIFSQHGTGQFEEKKVLTHTATFGPLLGTAVGLGVGALVGAAVAGLTSIVTDDIGDPWDPPKVPTTEEKKNQARQADMAPWIGAGVGAGVGALAGLWAGTVAQNHNVVLDQVIQKPVYQNELLGYIPRVSQKSSIPGELFHPGHKIYYSEVGDRFGQTPFAGGGQQIVRSVFSGRFEATHTVENSHWLTPARGAALGLGAGALTGLGAGVAAGILMKVAAGEDPPKRW